MLMLVLVLLLLLVLRGSHQNSGPWLLASATATLGRGSLQGGMGQLIFLQT